MNILIVDDEEIICSGMRRVTDQSIYQPDLNSRTR